MLTESELLVERKALATSPKVILDLCGGTGSWSNPYKQAGYEVVNVTLPEFDVRTYWEDYLASDYDLQERIYGVLCAPPCTMFSFARTHAKKKRNLEEGMETVKACLDIVWNLQYKTKSDHQKKAPLKFWALENPYGMLNWFLGKPAFTFHPYEFGDGYSKKTCLWGNFNEPKKLENYERVYNKKFDKLLMPELQQMRSQGDIIYKDSKNRQELRAITPPKFAQAFFEVNQ